MPVWKMVAADTTFGELYQSMGEVIDRAHDMSQDASDAAVIDTACKNYIAALESGAINDDEYARNVKADVLPAADATPEERREATLKCTIKGALEYAGLANVAFDFNKFAADDNGNIFAKTENKEAALETITADTTFETLGYENGMAAENADE